MQRRFLFNAFGETGWLVLLLTAALVAGTCIWLLYRYERRLVSRKLGSVLLLLRLLTVFVVFLTLLEPVVTWTVDREKTGRVILSVDLSDSMSTSDRHADKAERLRWLRAMKMIGNAEVDARLDRYLEAFKNDQEPEWVDPDEAGSDVERAEIAAGRKRQLEEMLETAGETSRKEIARRLITGGEDPLDGRLQKLALVERQVFAGQSSAVDRSSFGERIQDPGDLLRTETSDLLLGATPARGDSSSVPVAGIVLFTDGRDNADPEGTRLLQRLSTQGVPVYPVMMGSRERPRDLAIGRVDYPRTLYQKDKGIVTAEIRATGFEGQELTVTLQNRGDDSDRQTKTLRPNERSVDVSFTVEPDQVGRQDYTVHVDGRADETRDDNNDKSFSIKVLDEISDHSRVLVLEGEARWEFRFLNTALTRDESVTVDKVVFRQPYLGVLPGTFFPRELPLPDDAQARSAEESVFAAYDAVIIGDVPESQLSPSAWKQLDQFVRKEGGTLVMTAGKSHFPQTYRSPILNDLLPVTDLQPLRPTPREETGPPNERGFHLRLTPDGARQPMFQFGADPLENQAIWQRLPGHSWALRGRIKPAATVFVSLRDPQGNAGLEFERENALITHQHVGAGQTLWIGLDSTWRWRQRNGDAFHTRFWGQLSRWAARFKASAGDEFVRFGLERSEVDAGEDVLIRARWEERFLSQHPNLKARAELRPAGEPDAAPVMTVNLVPVDTRPRIHEAVVTGLGPGEYQVLLVSENADLGEDPIETELSVAPKLTTELAELAANHNLLDQLDEVNGGRVFFPDEVDQIPDLFRKLTESEDSRKEIALWDHWLVLLLCCGLLTSEWVLRKLNGLP